MGLSLAEYNSLLDFATKQSNKLSETLGAKVLSKPYSMYDGTKGIYLNVYSKDGSLYKQYASGVWDNLEQYKHSIQVQGACILRECR